MKRLLFIALLGVFFFCTAEGRDLFPVNWYGIEKITKENPEMVKSLVVRLSAATLDTTLTWDERRLAVYGQSILTENKEKSLVDKARDAYNTEDYKSAIELSKEVLEINPMNVSALNIGKNSIAKLVKSGDSGYTMAEGQILHNREQRIYNTIATTGDGSKENPFYVTCVSEEYCFMRYYLDLWEWSGQKLVGMCDVFTLTEKSDYYSSETIYFDTSRSLMIMHRQFENASGSY